MQTITVNFSKRVIIETQQIQSHTQKQAMSQNTANRLLWISKGQIHSNKQSGDNNRGKHIKAWNSTPL